MEIYGEVIDCFTGKPSNLYVGSYVDDVANKNKNCSIVLTACFNDGYYGKSWTEVHMTPKKCRELIKALQEAIVDVEKHNNNEVTENG